MQTSVFLARLLGPTLLLIGISLVLNREGFRNIAREFLNSRALIYISGILTFVPGLAVVLTHNVWTADWRVIVTLLGWLALLTGIVRTLFQPEVTRLGKRAINSPFAFTIVGAVMLVLGAILCFYGFVR